MLLRLIGSQLDRAGATGIRLLAVADGFTVTFSSGTAMAQVSMFHVSYDSLLDSSRHRRLSCVLPRRPALPWKRQFNGTYENLIRAVGHELDNARCFTILLDELDEGMLLTYQFFDPEAGFQLHKHRAVLSWEQLATIMTIALARANS
jgi:hypothetical protein